MLKTRVERFTEKYVKKLVVIDGKFLVCWIWTGAVNGKYPSFTAEDGRTVFAHRWSYAHFVGPIPDGMDVDHYRCWTPMCVNPDHLRPATRLANIRGGRNHNANKTHCKRGHPFDETNTYLSQKVVKGKTYTLRNCRACRREVARRYR
jgi:hypothetical protein